MFAAIIPALLPIFGNLLKSWFPDPEQAAKAQQELTLALMAQAAEINRAAADVVRLPASDFDRRAAHVKASLPATIVREGRLLYDARTIAAR